MGLDNVDFVNDVLHSIHPAGNRKCKLTDVKRADRPRESNDTPTAGYEKLREFVTMLC
jgi:hypothetical protein